MNVVILIGNTDAEPEVKTLESGARVAKFSLATSEKFKKKNSDEYEEQTTWHNIIAWRGLADIAEKYIAKGTMCCVEGKISNRSYNDKDGNKRYVSEIVAEKILALKNGKQSDNNSSRSTGFEETPPPPEPPQKSSDLDDLPFIMVLPYIAAGVLAMLCKVCVITSALFC